MSVAIIVRGEEHIQTNAEIAKEAVESQQGTSGGWEGVFCSQSLGGQPGATTW